MPARCKHHTGFTLLELLVTLMLVGIMAGMAMPPFARMLASASAERSIHRINAGISYARTLAVMNHHRTILCHLDDSNHCDGDWSAGFAVFADHNGNASLDAEETVLRIFEEVEGERIILRAFRSNRYFRFLPNGQTDWQNGRFIVCSDHPAVVPRVLVLNIQGRARRDHGPPPDNICDT